ncbi:hypothetical protein I3843_10G109600 [Carya illinoinensis]|uniref:ABC1 atypical kinase-like domain-containing protein n=1 Tax=Carya illinoinensis TaxID=32201 RepID=A0A922DXA5_CARIL|nr:hypothetical protein I3760_10G115300 [Carya illinoinensis]KAG6692489.1 hypothetical protein I3842_10G116600 [Carya illinoinensis]KAG7960172.1 hypothetical protein I3843_10G109600 [Carya illinoinensis]
MVGKHLPQYSLCSYYRFSRRGNGSLSFYETKKSFGHCFFWSFSTTSASRVVTDHAQVAWKRLYQKYSSNVSLLARSHLLVPGIFPFTCGQLAWAQGTWADTEHYPSQSTLHMRAQDGHAYVTTLLISVVEGVVLFVRALYLAILFSPSIMMASLVDCLGPRFRKFWFQVLHRTLEIAGPAFIKWELHNKAPEHSFAYINETIERAFGRELSELFENFEESPIASGSIAQVHRASLRFQYPGQQVKSMVVAVKEGFMIINLVATVSKFIPRLKWLRLDESVRQFAAAHLSRFIYNLHQWKNVSFPRPVYPLVHPAILVESYEQGESVSRYVEELEGHDQIKSVLAHIGTNALLKMLLVDNFIHADMQPGNILKRLFKSKPHVIFLDAGMIAELSGSDWVNLLEFFKAVACALRLSKQQNCPNQNAFIEEVEDAFTFCGTPESDLIHPAECMQQLLEKVRHHRVNIDGNVCTVLVTTLVLEGWQQKFDPSYDVMHTLQMVVH